MPPAPTPTAHQLFLNWESCGQRIKRWSMWLYMSVCKGNFAVYEHKEALWLVLLVFLGLPTPLTSALRLPSPHHLWSVSPSQEENADGFLQPAHRPSLSGVCVCASACTLGGNQSKKKAKLRSSIVQHVSPEVQIEETFCTWTLLHFPPPCKPLILTLRVHPSPLVSVSVSFSLSLSVLYILWFCLPPSSCLDGGPAALGCLGSGGIPISSSNHDIILPQ